MIQQKRKKVFFHKFNYQTIPLKKDMLVLVISGESKGKIGTVLSFNKEKGLVIIDNVNLKKRAIKKTAQEPGRFVDLKHPIHISNIKVFNKQKNEFVALRKMKNQINQEALKLQQTESDKKVSFCELKKEMKKKNISVF